MTERSPKSNKRRRRLLIAGIIGTLLVGWLTYEILLSPGAAIRRAEAFLFRRMTVVQIEEGRYRYFYATNRKLESGDDSIEDRVTSEHSDTLKFGAYDISLSPMLGLGLDLSWADMLQTEMISVDEIREHEKESFVETLQGYVNASPRRSVFIMVHG